MIEYTLKDKDGNTFSLNGASVTIPLKESWTQKSDTFTYDNNIVESTYLPGALKISESRIASRDFSLGVTISNDNHLQFRTDVNTLLEFVSRTKYLVDETNLMQIEISVVNASVEYNKGTLKHLAEVTLDFIALTPYWEATVADQIIGSTLADTIKQVSINNEGFLSSPPIVTLVTTAEINNVLMYLSSNTEGIQINDDTFGTTGNLTMIIDCVVGEITIGLLNVNTSIAASTGFFHFPVGLDTLNIYGADVAMSYTIEFYKRYFV